jgi:glycerate kinase
MSFNQKMKILIAPDSFKGCMTSFEACSAIEGGVLRADGDAVVYKIPLADGGEGTAHSITRAAGGKFVKTAVTDPLGRKIEAEFGLIDGGKTAVLDIASASGIELLARNELNPLLATSYGSGELIHAALDTGAKELVIGIGGSAVNDGGLGMLAALGFDITDKDGKPAGRYGKDLINIASFNCERADKRLKTVSIKVACDVTNPLLGQHGASAVFGSQKGADADMVNALDAGLSKLADAWIRAGLACDVTQPGDGAAGGIGAAMRICLGAKMESGAMLVMKHSGFFDRLPGCDLVITGEGKTDDQTASGKLCSVVARECRAAGVPVALLSGALEGDVNKLLSVYDYAASICCGETSLEDMIKNGKRNLGFASENLIRALKTMS